jgi:DNA repair exonuclease SbcCD ATPase subunit
MKAVNFKKVRIVNFLSIGKTPVEIEFTPGIHLITGINRDKTDRRNGVGKSSVIESIYFAIFGNTLRELKKDLIANNFTNSTCEVVLDFEIVDKVKTDYRIIRTLNPSKLYLYENGKDVTRDTIKNTEEVIYKLLNATPSLFENCVIMSLNNSVPFMAKNKVEKRKFIESIFNLEVFSRMMSLAREDFFNNKKLYEIELAKFEEVNKNYTNLVTQKNNILNTRKEKLNVYIQRKHNNTLEKTELTKKLNSIKIDSIDKYNTNLKKLKDGLAECETKIEKASEQKNFSSRDVVMLKKQLNEIGTPEATCPTCLRTILEHDIQTINDEKEKIRLKISAVEQRIEEYNSSIVTLKNKKGNIGELIDVCNKGISNIDLKIQEKRNTENRLAQIIDWLSQLETDIEHLKSNVTDIDDIIKTNELKIQDLQKDISSLKAYNNVLDTVKFIVSEEGVKSYIVNKILEVFNNKLTYYLKKMNANSYCFFNEYFEEEIINEKGKICSYFNFSGAERKDIDLACLFTFMDMRRLQGDITYNLSVYDELFDSSLDETGIDQVTNILKERVEKYNECIMVISHRKESIKAITGNVIFLEKKNGQTKKIDYNPFITK